VNWADKDIQLLKKTIKETHGCESHWIASVKVREEFQGKIAWDGEVEVFLLVDHPKAKYAYAWTYREGKQNKTVVILDLPPVHSPQSAVNVAIASKARQNPK
jgi:hypothetical protein